MTPAFTQLTDLAAARFGGRTLSCSDDFFAEKENLIQSGRGIFIPDKYTENGKWMDGWESRRKRTEGYDWCIVQLGASGTVHGVDIDTNHFLGNHPPFASIEACYAPLAVTHKLQAVNGASSLTQNQQTHSETGPSVFGLENAVWTKILPKSPLNAGSQNFYALENRQTWTHIRLNIYPDGGVARLKVYGEVRKNWQNVAADALACNDEFFSKKDNINMPNRGANMGNGWETKRNRTPNNRDWLVLRLARKGRIQKIIIDTGHFKGNYPDRCKLEGCNLAKENEDNLDAATWMPMLNESKLQADFEHIFTTQILVNEPFTHVRLTIFPDGGISRLRLFGFVETDVLTLEELNETTPSVCEDYLSKCCGATNWVQKMVAARPFLSREDVLEKAETAWFACKKSDWLEAFTHHPKIGDVESLKKKFASTAAWASGEQSNVQAASAAVIEELKLYNDLYVNKFGFIFIVFATGKTAVEMLSILKTRYENEAVEEIVNALLEQNKITKIRIEKLLL